MEQPAAEAAKWRQRWQCWWIIHAGSWGMLQCSAVCPSSQASQLLSLLRILHLCTLCTACSHTPHLACNDSFSSASSAMRRRVSASISLSSPHPPAALLAAAAALSCTACRCSRHSCSSALA
jgi:hypothetical protein